MATYSQYDSGSAEYGNFSNYYSFYPPKERVKLLPFEMLSSKSEYPICLDIGCNTGELTVALYNEMARYNSVRILGVDIDPLLIEKAKQTSTSQFITFECINVLDDKFNFLCESFLQAQSRQNFDVVFLFSVTMWIHLNNGDEGLKLFLRNVSNKTNLIVLEPQPWKCYKAAVRRRKRAKKDIFKFWKEMKLRDTIEEHLVNFLCKECSFECIWTSEKTIWGREISLFKKVER